MPKNNSDNFDEKNEMIDEIEDISWDDVGVEDDKKKDPAASAPKKKGAEKQPQFSELKKDSPPGSQQNIDFILEIPLEVTVELGKTSMPIFELLQLGQGSIIELDKVAGEPLEILVNKKLIARGEVVSVNDKFGIRLTEVVSTKERVETLT